MGLRGGGIGIYEILKTFESGLESGDGIFFSPEDLESLDFWFHLCFFWRQAFLSQTIFRQSTKKAKAGIEVKTTRLRQARKQSALKMKNRPSGITDTWPI